MRMTKENAKHYVWGALCDGWHLVNTAELSVVRERMPPNAKAVMHQHEVARQYFYILEGEAEFIMNGETVTLCANEGIEVPPGVPHQMKNTSSKDVQFLLISQPNMKEAARVERVVS